MIARKAQDRRISGVTLEWVLWGEGTGPQKAPHTAPSYSRSAGQKSAHADAPQAASVPSPTPGESHGHYAARIGAAVQADLGRNEFGQWSSVEVQHTVLWALKDLARRLRVLRFDMGKTFELTDEWAGQIGLPVRPLNGSSDEENPDT